MLSETYNSLKAYLYDRTTSPLLGSLVFSWIIWNYKFILLLFSNLSYPDKLRMINILYDSDFNFYITGFTAPLLTALFYIYIFPYPSKYVFKFSLERQDELNALKQKIHNNQLISLEKSQSLRKRISELSLEHAQEIEELENKVEYLSEQNSKLESEVKRLNKSHIIQSVEIEKPINKDESTPISQPIASYRDRAEMLILDFFDENENKPTEKSEIINFLSQNFHLKKYLIEKIFDDVLRGAIIETDTSHGSLKYKLTSYGLSKIIDSIPNLNF
ncbi:hypothetical protein RZY48_001453 [Vibrio navarrensis]|uniref:Uncharacterized protein n=1 Tax=Vibrio navarrensis TaxID=29495 RepID=A0AAI9CTK7_9VIBR|nr:hypothetical protein [Vibrio navarrensis]